MLNSSQVPAWSIAAALAGGVVCSAVHAADPSQDPADPQAAVPQLVYQSPFADARKLDEPAMGKWRRANERVLKPDPHAGHSHPGK